MRYLLCGVAAVALSGCSWLGLGKTQHPSIGPGDYHAAPLGDPNCCTNGQTLSRWNLEGGIGTELITGGESITGSKAHQNNVFPTNTFRNVNAQDAYDPGTTARLGISYAMTPNSKYTIEAFSSQSDGKDVNWGTQGVNQLRGRMSDYKAQGVEFGYRKYMPIARAPFVHSFRPYLGANVGVAHLDDAVLTNIREVGAGVPDPRTPTSLKMYESGWVPTLGANIGFETPLTRRATIGVETGFRWTGRPAADDADIGGVGTPFNQRYAGINNGGDRYTIPLTIRGRYRF